MTDFHLMNVYVAVAETEGFASGARRLGMSPPAVTRAIATLEENLGVKLLNRTTRYVRTTEAGKRYLTDAKKILHDVQLANDAAIGINATPKGHLSITAPALFGRMHITPAIVKYLTQYPDTDVNAVFLDRIVNLLEEDIDVGIRIGELPDSSMRALRVGSVRLILCASPEYLAKYGTPNSIEDLQQHTIISTRAINANNDWQFQFKEKKQTIKLKPRLTTTSNDAAIEAALNHFGIVRVVSYQVGEELINGRLTMILEQYQLDEKPIHIIHRENHLTTAKVRAFIDLVAHQLKNNNILN